MPGPVSVSNGSLFPEMLRRLQKQGLAPNKKGDGFPSPFPFNLGEDYGLADRHPRLGIVFFSHNQAPPPLMPPE